jgi:hypothetical protein
MNTFDTTWSKRTLSIEHLKLDINNPRFSYQSSINMNQTQIVKFLIDKFDVFELAKDIAFNGYLIGEEPIVCKERDNYIVLEGNRRMAACKILLDPEKYLSKQRASTLKHGRFMFEKMECHIAASRKDANNLIYRRHNGIPIKKWSKISQDAYLHNLISIEQVNIEDIHTDLGVIPSEIRKALRRYNVHQYAIKLFKHEPNELAEIAQENFPITTLERFYDHSEGAKFLGISFSPNGKIKRILPPQEFNVRFMYIIRDILSDKLNSRSFNGPDEQQEYLNTLYNIFNIHVSRLLEAEFANQEDAHTNTPEKEHLPPKESKPPHTSTPSNKLFGDVEWATGIYRIDLLFQSLQRINHKKNLDVIALSLRCYLDMIIHQYLIKKEQIDIICEKENVEINRENTKKVEKVKKYLIETHAILEEEINEDELRKNLNLFEKRGSNFAPTLHKMITHIAGTPELLPESKQREALLQFSKQGNQILNLKDFNLLIHNQYYNITVEQLKNSVINLLPLLEHINDELKHAE